MAYQHSSGQDRLRPILSSRATVGALSNAERQARYRKKRKVLENQENEVNLANRADPQANCIVNDFRRDQTMERFWSTATSYYKKHFKDNQFGFSCNVCDRLWFRNDLKKVKESHLSILKPIFGDESEAYYVCANCWKTMNRGRLPSLSSSNGFLYPFKPANLPNLDPISARLISPRLPFMAIRRLTRDGMHGIIGQVINVPVDVDNMVRQLPRQLDDDYAINVSIKRKLIHKSSYLAGHVKKGVIKAWLQFLLNQPLYRHYNITVDWTVFDSEVSAERDAHDSDEFIENIDTNAPEINSLIARQNTLFWSEENILDIAPGQNRTPLNIIYDSYAEELSFPQIYLGNGRFFKAGVRVTPYMISNSEIRRTDRRGATPEHILYMAMKILRLRLVDGMYNSFICADRTENITRRMIDDRQFLQECIDQNLSFLKSIPNSVQYWMSKKKDLFAMIRQLGKPSAFLTMSASEIKWPELLVVLQKLSKEFNHMDIIDLMHISNKSKRCHLVNEDPVTCCVYFHKLVDIIMRMLTSKAYHNPFGKYRAIDYFLRIEFQHRGSPHAHILLWLENDPKESISEDMPATIQLVTDLCSVSQQDLNFDMYQNQIHKHTFTCTKRGEESCRFHIPYWPTKSSRVLLPMSQDDGRRVSLRRKAKKVRELLEIKEYETIDSFLEDNNLDENTYYDMIRSTLSRPTLLFRRQMSEIRTNTFHPWIAKILNSNMDLQFILEEYSCAAYVVEYVNKTNRGTGNLHRELIKLSVEHPEMTNEMLLKRLGSRVLNSVEMSSQEAAWYLLRQPMSQFSRDVVFIPTNLPCERRKSFKRKSQLDVLEPNSTDIWTKSLIQKYEERPDDLQQLCLADYAAWYTIPIRSSTDGDTFEDDENLDESRLTAQRCTRRKFSRIIRYRNYDSSDTNNYKRELVTLFLPFKNELVDIIDRNKFLALYDEKIVIITLKRQEYEQLANFDQLMEEYRQITDTDDHDPMAARVVERENWVTGILPEKQAENFDDLETNTGGNIISIVRRRENVLTKEEYCLKMRTTNERQRELIHEIIHRIHSPDEEALQIFFTGPAGCGKTYVLKLIMETYNRYSQEQNFLNNSYVACASTGKAAVNLGGTTVHSAFHITQSLRVNSIAQETLQRYRQLFVNIKCVIIDEVSMVSSDVLHKVNHRLQEITGQLDAPFGGMNVVFCGDFRQLPPVRASPVYKSNRHRLDGCLLWQTLNYFPLNKVMRQNDMTFSSILTKIGEGKPLTKSESEIIEARFYSEQWCEQNLKGVVRLYHQNHLVDAYNKKTVLGGLEHIANDVISGYSSNVDLASARGQLHKMSTNDTSGLPYSLTLAVGYPYMITTNVDVEDGLVNGSLGILKFVEDLSNLQNTHGKDPDRNQLRVWLLFPNESIGDKARLKHKAIFATRQGEIGADWTPISSKTATISLAGVVKCRRLQLPLTPACAITIHKSQGGTFDRAVIQYDKAQQNQLVYVALSRVTSLEGLYLVNANNDLIFHHKRGCTSPSVKEIRDEYARLSSHPLSTISGKVKNFIARENENQIIILCTINAQSLVAHSEDIETDFIITQADILAITETWMDESTTISINGYELVIDSRKLDNEVPSSDQSRRRAGGVAMYRKLKSDVDFGTNEFMVAEQRRRQENRIGDAVAAEISIRDNFKILLYVVYIHPKSSKEDVSSFLLRVLHNHCVAALQSPGEDIEMPLIITGDFNINIQDDKWIIEFMENKFNLAYVVSPSPTTIGDTYIDLTFVRYLDASCLPFVSYFSYHRPLFSKISIPS